MLIRLASPADALGVARVHVRSWQVAYRILLPDDYLDRLRPQERAQRYEFGSDDPSKPVTMVAVDNDAIIGFATIAPARDPDVAACGELCALHVDPNRLGEGIGLALISTARDRLYQLGFRHALLWVLKGNARAERFYCRDGWSADGQRRTGTVWGVTLDEIRFRRTLTHQ